MPMGDEIVASFDYDLRALRLEYKTTCEALRYWPVELQKNRSFLCTRSRSCSGFLAEQTLQIEAS